MHINWNLRSYTEQEFRETWLDSCSIADCARKLGIGPFSPTTRNTAKALGLTTEHMTHRARNATRLPIEHFLVSDKIVSSHDLKLKLFNAELKQRKCEQCGITEWNNKPAPLELDHVNGDRKDNRLENLRILCPNCHAQTPTYRGKNISPEYRALLEANRNRCAHPECDKVIDRNRKNCIQHRTKLSSKAQPDNVTRCKECTLEITPGCDHCIPCAKKLKEKIAWPSNEELWALLEQSNFSKLARELGVSNTAIRKRLGVYHTQRKNP